LTQDITDTGNRVVALGSRTVEWTKDAENAVKKVPFFVRKKVRVRIETQVMETGKKTVTLADVKTAQKRHLQKMSEEIKGYQIDTCFGPGGCPNRTVPSEKLLERVEEIIAAKDLLSFLKHHVQGDLKYHHEFRVTLAECPNACSQPQIKDIGIIAALVPGVTDEACTGCKACVEACPDNCIHLKLTPEKPEIDMDRCMSCGKCVGVCPTQTIRERKKGFRVLLGGKLGRHPRLAMELPGVYTEKKVLDIIHYCITFYKRNSRNGQRFAQIFKKSDFDVLVKKLEHD
jgi:anaerobic sulfite reductase subunit C